MTTVAGTADALRHPGPSDPRSYTAARRGRLWKQRRWAARLLRLARRGNRLMPRIRTYKPEFFTSEDVSVLPFRARLTWLGLWTQCDDHGRTKDNVKLIKAAVWPLDDVSLRDVEEDLSTLDGRGRIVRYTVSDVRFLAVVNWHFHQSVNRPGKPKFPAPPVRMPAPAKDETGHCALCFGEFVAQGGLTEPPPPVDNSTVDVPAGQATHGGLTEDAVSPHDTLTEGSRQERKGTGKGKEGTRARARCPRHNNLPPDAPGPNCIACRDARITAETVAAEQEQRAAAQFAEETRQLAEARVLAIANCSVCDARGYVGARLCDHDPAQAEVNANGVAKAWAAIGRPAAGGTR